MERNHKLNFLEGFACIEVVFIHITFPEMFGEIVKCVYAWGKGTETMKRRLIKIIKIFLYAYALFGAYSIAGAIMDHDIGVWFSTHFNWKTPIKYIFSVQ